MIDVHLFASQNLKSSGGRQGFRVHAQPGLTVLEIMEAEGLEAGEFHLVLINGVHGTFQSQLKDGDRLSLFPPIAGG